MTISINDTQPISIECYYSECHVFYCYAEFHYAECLGTGLISVVKIELILQFCKVAFYSSQPSLIFASNVIVKRAPLG
jgi:hypothetical protein